MKVADNCVVSIHYTLTDEQGVELDSSAGGEPLAYLHGQNGIIPGLERELTGREEGDKLQVTVQPQDGYGDVNPDLVQLVPSSAFQGVDNVEAGMQFQAQGPDGQTQLVTVRDVAEDGVTVDANHPLAGQVLSFDVTIAGVREATAEELSHGHVH